MKQFVLLFTSASVMLYLADGLLQADDVTYFRQDYGIASGSNALPQEFGADAQLVCGEFPWSPGSRRHASMKNTSS